MTHLLSSDSASSERNSPIVDEQLQTLNQTLNQTVNQTLNQTLPEQRQSLLEQHHRHSSMGDIHV